MSSYRLIEAEKTSFSVGLMCRSSESLARATTIGGTECPRREVARMRLSQGES